MECGECYIRAAIEWSAVADAVRWVWPTTDDPLRTVALGMPRELAWCYVLVKAGRPNAAVERLRTILCDAVGSDHPPFTTPAALLARIRSAVSARWPELVSCRSDAPPHSTVLGC